MKAYHSLAFGPLAALCLAPSSGFSAGDAERTAFVEANVVAILYHELAHAVIDLMGVPIFGQEEDAADVMAVLLIDRIFDEDTAQAIVYDSAFGYIDDPEGDTEVAWWDVHGPDEQRFYNHVCIFYGGDPDHRDDLAAELGLPDERAETCPEEFDLAADSWGGVFEEMAAVTPGTLEFVDTSDGTFPAISTLLDDEIDALNADFGLPETVEVRLETCDEPNAFYDPEDASITFCTEFVPYLEDLYEALSA